MNTYMTPEWKLEHEVNTLRKEGCPDEEIAARLSLHIGVIRQTPLPRPQPQRERAVQHMQLQSLHQTFMPKAVAGDAEAAGVVLKVQRRHADLLGLDAPKQTVNLNYDGGDIASIPTHVLKQMLADQAGLIVDVTPEPTDPENNPPQA